MTKRPVTDMNDLVDLKVDQRMRAYVVYNSEEHRQTRSKIKDLECVLRERESSKIHNLIQDVVIGVIIIFMLVAITGC